MTVTKFGPAGPRVGIGAGVAESGPRAAVRSIGCYCISSVQWGIPVRQPGVGVRCFHRGWARHAMRAWESRRTPSLIQATP